MENFVGQQIFCWSQFDLSIVHCIAKAYGWSTLKNRPKTRDIITLGSNQIDVYNISVQFTLHIIYYLEKSPLERGEAKRRETAQDPPLCPATVTLIYVIYVKYTSMFYDIYISTYVRWEMYMS